MRFEFHCHSNYSKGTLVPYEALPDPAAIIAQANRIGLTGIALTDHNSVSGWKEATQEAKKQGIIFIPGEEITTASGHLLALGITEFIPPGMPVPETVDAVHDQGGIAIGDHPFDLKGDGMKWEIRHVDAVEVHNALNIDKLSNRFAETQARKLRKPMVAGSDAHTLEMIGIAPNILEAQTLDEVLRAVKKGRIAFERGYIPLELLIVWARERFVRSYDHVVDHIDRTYIYPKAWLSKHMMDKFITHRSSFWQYFAAAGLHITRFYGTFKLRQYANGHQGF